MTVAELVRELIQRDGSRQVLLADLHAAAIGGESIPTRDVFVLLDGTGDWNPGALILGAFR